MAARGVYASACLGVGWEMNKKEKREMRMHCHKLISNQFLSQYNSIQIGIGLG